MAIRQLRLSGYRSIRELTLKAGKLNVIVGPNGSGKSNLYRGLELVVAASQGRLALELALEGGMPSALWAGERGRGPVRMVLSVGVDEFEYEVQSGLPTPIPGGSMFQLDPEIKSEHVWFLQAARRTVLMERAGGTMHARDSNGDRVTFPMTLGPSDTALAELREPDRFPVLAMLRQELAAWRFYHQFRTDRDSPIRRALPGCRTPILSPDGRDLAAALQTIREVGDAPALNQALHLAFPGATLEVLGPDPSTHGSGFVLALHSSEFKRPFQAIELSDGTLQYLCLLAALLSPRPPSVVALNEPETSIHPHLIPPLAKLIVGAAEKSQVWVTTHSVPLAGEIERLSRVRPIRLAKINGETRIVDSD